jgi:acetyl esterase/lipase
MGDSAGGGLATATALLARDRGLYPPVKCQMFMSPMLEDLAVAGLLSGAERGESPLLGFATVPP